MGEVVSTDIMGMVLFWFRAIYTNPLHERVEAAREELRVARQKLEALQNERDQNLHQQIRRMKRS